MPNEGLEYENYLIFVLSSLMNDTVHVHITYIITNKVHICIFWLIILGEYTTTYHTLDLPLTPKSPVSVSVSVSVSDFDTKKIRVSVSVSEFLTPKILVSVSVSDVRDTRKTGVGVGVGVSVGFPTPTPTPTFLYFLLI